MVFHDVNVEDGEGKHGEEIVDGQDWECGAVSDVVNVNESDGGVVWKLEWNDESGVGQRDGERSDGDEDEGSAGTCGENEIVDAKSVD